MNKKLKIENCKEKINNNNNYYYNINNTYDHFVLIQSHYKSIKFNELLILEKNFYICNLIISNFKNYKLYFQLLYKATIDGDKAQNFHNKVDGKGPLIILVKTSNDIILGGYTSKAWSSSNEYMNDSEAFLFSLTCEKKYKIIKPEYACLHLENDGPCFGNNGELKIVDNCLSEDSLVCNYSESYFINKKNLIEEKDNYFFKVKDYEVYQIINNN